MIAATPMTSQTSPEASAPGGSSARQPLRLALYGVLVLGLVGTLAELLLLGHMEGPWQKVPVALITSSFLVLGWRLFDRKSRSRRALQGVMALFVVGGALGLWFHYQGNVAFELELAPALSGWELFGEAMTGATPALAPAAMIQLGLLGLIVANRPSPNPADSHRTAQKTDSSDQDPPANGGQE